MVQNCTYLSYHIVHYPQQYNFWARHNIFWLLLKKIPIFEIVKSTKNSNAFTVFSSCKLHYGQVKYKLFHLYLCLGNTFFFFFFNILFPAQRFKVHFFSVSVSLKGLSLENETGEQLYDLIKKIREEPLRILKIVQYFFT